MATDIRGATVGSPDPPIGTNPNPDLAIKAPVRVATTGSNITLSALQTIDGVVLAAGDRVLVKDQTDTTTNGIYNASTGAWTRAIDAANNSQWTTGTQLIVTTGAVNANQTYKCTAATPIVLGTSALTFSAVIAPFLVLAKNNSVPAITLTTPDATSATWDSTPLAALYIATPPTATTRNFLSGIWVETNAASVDKGRGIGIHNTGASDSLYIQNDGVSSTGLAVLLQTGATGATGAVIGTTLASHVALNLRQETGILGAASSACLLQIDANGAATEMVRFNSTVASQVGIVFRMTGGNAQPINVQNANGNQVFLVNNTGGALLGNAGIPGSLLFGNNTSGLLTITPVAGVALGSNTLSLPNATDTLVGKATTDTLTNKTFVAPVLGAASATTLSVGGNQVVGARITGYAAMTNTKNKATAYDTTTITLAQLASRVGQLQDDLTTHGLIGA